MLFNDEYEDNDNKVEDRFIKIKKSIFPWIKPKRIINNHKYLYKEKPHVEFEFHVENIRIARVDAKDQI